MPRAPRVYDFQASSFERIDIPSCHCEAVVFAVKAKVGSDISVEGILAYQDEDVIKLTSRAIIQTSSVQPAICLWLDRNSSLQHQLVLPLRER